MKPIDARSILRKLWIKTELEDSRTRIGIGEAISALEKQIVKPPENKVHEKYKALGKNYYCSCGAMFVDFERNGTNYCGNCGQKLREAKE